MNYDGASDQDLVVQVLRGEGREAFEELVNRYQRPIFNLTYRMLGEAREAEDAAQETFLRAYQHLERYDTQRSLKTWLLSIASNYCIDCLRKRRLTWLSLDEPLAPHPNLASRDPQPEEAALAVERGAAVQALLKELQPEYRAAVVLRYWYDMSYLEIADTLGTTESAIKSRLFRARQMMAEKLKVNGSARFAAAVEGAR